MSKQLLILLLSLQTVLWTPAALGADANPAQTEPVHTFLQGSVHHKEYLDPVPPSLKAGAKIDLQALQPLVAGNNWIPIPDWLGGTWQFKNENVTDMVNYTNVNYTKPPYTIRNENQKTLGQQKDRTGQIWYYLQAPRSYVTKLNGGLLGYERITSMEPISCDNTDVALNVTGTDTQVDPKTQVVTSTDQSEAFNHYTRAGKDSIKLGGSAKHFDMSGRPTMDMTSYLKGKRIKPFAIIDQEDGYNLKQMFIDFLKSHGKADLVPE